MYIINELRKLFKNIYNLSDKEIEIEVRDKWEIRDVIKQRKFLFFKPKIFYIYSLRETIIIEIPLQDRFYFHDIASLELDVKHGRITLVLTEGKIEDNRMKLIYDVVGEIKELIRSVDYI